MKLLKITVITLCVGISGLAIAQEHTQQEDMSKLQAKMGQMQKMMDQIKQTNDSKRKNEILEQHMKDMQSQMTGMSAMMKNMGQLGAGSANCWRPASRCCCTWT